MSNFICDQCGKTCTDSPRGYVTGCEHYPADIAPDEFGRFVDGEIVIHWRDGRVYIADVGSPLIARMDPA